MTVRDWLAFLTIVGALVLMFAVSRHSRTERVQPGSAEYAAYIEQYVAECLAKDWAAAPTDGAARGDGEREAACRAFVSEADRLNPAARPMRRN